MQSLYLEICSIMDISGLGFVLLAKNIAQMMVMISKLKVETIIHILLLTISYYQEDPLP